ncbi:MAG TPA: hypothetical protein VGC99_13550 [Candidatus Tectomicrobia bacterium]
MTINQLPLTAARWRRLHPELRAELRQALGGKSAIIDRQVLDVARALYAHSAHGLALALYEALQGEPLAEYQGCGLGRLMDLRAFMGEDPDRHDTWVYGSEEAPLLLPTRNLSREARK